MSEPERDVLGKNEYARHRGVRPHAVLKAVRTGRIARAAVFGPGGKIVGIKWRLADQLWSENTDPVQSMRGKGFQAAKAANTPGQLPGAAVWTAHDARALGRAVALARLECLQACQASGFLDSEPLTSSELLDLCDMFIVALGKSLAAAVGMGPANAVTQQLLDVARPVRSLTLEQAIELARAAIP